MEKTFDDHQLKLNQLNSMIKIMKEINHHVIYNILKTKIIPNSVSKMPKYTSQGKIRTGRPVKKER